MRGVVVIKRCDALDTFFLICGKSGSGKTTILNRVENSYGLIQLQSYTTRPPRYEGEKGHIFVSKRVFDLLHPRVAYTNYNGYEYCATIAQVNESDLLTIDPFGIDFFKKAYTGEKNVKIVYIFVSDEERMARMRKRGDCSEDIIKRIEYDEQAFKGIECAADVIICNDNMEECISKLLKYINLNSERGRLHGIK